MRLSVVTIFFIVLLGSVAVAQTAVRDLPENARRGYLSHLQGNVVSLDGKALKVSPGGQIRGTNNLIVQPTALPRNSLVKYQLDKNGELFRAWILTQEEAAKPDKFGTQRPPWATSPEEGRPFEQVSPTQPRTNP